ncbi:MAG: IgGFc-binding protein [Myxococcaceae bacterium]
MRTLLISAVLAFLTGCGCGNTITIGGDGGLGGGTAGGGAGGGAGAGAFGGGTSTGGGAGGGAGTGGGAACVSTCSDDLQSVIDCHGNPTHCPNGLGCGADGGCIDACEAAQGSTIGCEFFLAAGGPQPDTAGSCYAAFVANTWDAPITINVDQAGTPLNASDFAKTPVGQGAGITYQGLPAAGMGVTLDPGKMAILFLAQFNNGAEAYYIPCPVTPAVQTNFMLEGTGIIPPFHFTSTAPVIAYDIYPYGGAQSHVTSASLLIPVSAWGTNYVGATPHTSNASLPGFTSYLQVFASEDGTQVAVQAPVAIAGGGTVTPVPQGQVGHYTLNRNQVMQLQQADDLSGTLIKSDKPIAVWGGIPCMDEPDNMGYCDSAHQQFPAVPLLGSQYVGAEYALRAAVDPSYWRIVGAVDGTTLTFAPPQPGAPSAVNAGQTIEFIATDANFVIYSQDDNHPFYFSELMTGGGDPGATFNGAGDPDWVNVVPPLQWLRSYLFFTDPTYATTDLVFVRGQGSDGQFHDVTLDCYGVLAAWAPVGNAPYQVSHVGWNMQSGNCSNGVHTASSEAPFGLTVWGTDLNTSYAYPAGMSVKPINTVVVGPMLN